MTLARHLFEYHEAAKAIPKQNKFSSNEIALLKALSEKPQNTKELAEKVGIESTTVLRIIKRLTDEYKCIECQSFGRAAPSLFWRSEYSSVYDEI